eukprot:gene1450-1792_t
MHSFIILLTTSALPLVLVAATEALQSHGILSSSSSRKFLHISTGLLYMLTWPLYDSNPTARCYAAALPGLMTVRFVLAGLGVTNEPRLVAGTARSGQRQELLTGPTFYGLAHVVLTLLAWRSAPAVAGIAALCAGDGLADIVGRRWGGAGSWIGGSLPHNRNKTWAGSLGCFFGSCVATYGYLKLFSGLGCLSVAPQLSAHIMLRTSVNVSLVAALVESLPLQEMDNLTVPAAAAALAWWLLGW